MKHVITSLVVLFFSITISAQQKTISGTITSHTDGLPIPDTSVTIKGSNSGVQSNFEGLYSISAKSGDTLAFTYIGMKGIEVIVKDQNIINVVLEEDHTKLSEVVIEAYRTKLKGKSNIASTTISAESIKKRPNAKFAQTLQGQVSGLNITTSNGQSVRKSNIIIRGNSSLSARSKLKLYSGNLQHQTQVNVAESPSNLLYILDGQPISESQFRAIKSNKIKHLEVLNSMQGNAIYGNRGAQGVVLMRTKGPKNNVDFNVIQDVLHESYASVDENAFKSTNVSPLSTFSIDVDKAGYSNIRRMINSGNTIPKDAVKIEEMVNYFNYNYPKPKDKHPFSMTTELVKTPWNSKTQLVRIGLQGKTYDNDKLPASNLTFLIDVSGSMNSPNKLPLLKQAFKILVNQLREKDKVSILVYAGAAGVVLEPTSGDNKQLILEALNKLQAGGSTAGGAGIHLAYDLAEKHFIKEGNNRVILATDGDFNVGVSSDKDMKTLIEDKRKSGVYLSVLGFGYGNYKDSKLEILADKGNGNHAYVDNMQEAQKVFGKEFGGTLFTIAKDVKIQVEFNPKKVQAYRLIGYENRLLADKDFTDDTKDAGELGSGHTVTALYEVIPSGVDSPYLNSITNLKYTKTTLVNDFNNELFTVKFRYKKPSGSKSIEMIHVQSTETKRASEDMNFASAVALFGMKLKESQYDNNTSLQDIISLANKGRGEDKDGYRAEFIRLVESYEHM